MQTPRLPLHVGTLCLAAVLPCLAFTARGAQTPTSPAGRTGAPANAAHAEPAAPKSVFHVPASPQEGRDPFFPQSRRHTPRAVVATTTQPMVVAELELKGISGSADHPLAIINNRTFEPGEEGTILSNTGRLRIICKEIKEDSVRVIVNGQERTLTLRPR